MLTTQILLFFNLLSLTSSQNLSLFRKDMIDQYFVPRVVNGKPAGLYDVPYQISFKQKTSFFTSEYISFCGGSLLKPKKILSAAHCFEEKRICKPLGSVFHVSARKLKRIMAVAGNLYNKDKYLEIIKNRGQWRTLHKIIYPNSYKFPKDDIAVAITKMKFYLDSSIATIPYAAVHKDYTGTCRISGFGRISETKGSAILLYADVAVLPSILCTKMHRKRMSKFICTSDAVSDVHKGDSGGPLVCTNTGDPAEKKIGIVVGVVSGNRVNVGSFFTRTSAYKGFIESKTATNSNKNVILMSFLINIEILLFLLCFIWFLTFAFPLTSSKFVLICFAGIHVIAQ